MAVLFVENLGGNLMSAKEVSKIDYNMVLTNFIVFILAALVGGFLSVTLGNYSFPIWSSIIFGLSVVLVCRCCQLVFDDSIFLGDTAESGALMIPLCILLGISSLASRSLIFAALALAFQILIFVFFFSRRKVGDCSLSVVNGRVYYSGEVFKLHPFVRYKIFNLPLHPQNLEIVLENLEIPCLLEGSYSTTIKMNVHISVDPSAGRSLDYEMFMRDIRKELEVYLLRLAHSGNFKEFLANLFQKDFNFTIHGLKVSLPSYGLKEVKSSSQQKY